MDIIPVINGTTPSTDGTDPAIFDCNANSASASIELTIKADTTGYYKEGPTDISVASTRTRLSLDNSTWSAWGGSVTIPGNISFTGTVIYIQVRSLAGDTDDGVSPYDVLLDGELLIPISTLVAEAGFSAAGTVAVNTTLVGAVTATLATVGTAIATSAATLDATIKGQITAEGTAIAVSSLTGAVTSKRVTAGTIVATSTATGTATIAAGNVATGNFYLKDSDSTLVSSTSGVGDLTLSAFVEQPYVRIKFGSGAYGTGVALNMVANEFSDNSVTATAGSSDTTMTIQVDNQSNFSSPYYDKTFTITGGNPFTSGTRTAHIWAYYDEADSGEYYVTITDAASSHFSYVIAG